MSAPTSGEENLGFFFFWNLEMASSLQTRTSLQGELASLQTEHSALQVRATSLPIHAAEKRKSAVQQIT